MLYHEKTEVKTDSIKSACEDAQRDSGNCHEKEHEQICIDQAIY